ncbi:hypothetical protein BO94DRAFT_148975 [Aspergillus sclerotioniger CBS 115572]|uniref:Uncharacterized protein n=1 Tax=Aspergillus sclerotioniger CBS 115572 TaxID=1450535 RepID=A0A317W407_9EURO|nr:hypothetical protein BO94DRAFT_148975 [Aspergillus sclerotioniger CBS 115572]PWY80735.1 hypothetical protein BO94DRAFT_148975 [Aspergillus sclerotioniger CBS 115572]
MDIQSLLNEGSPSFAPNYGLPRFQNAEGANSLLLVSLTDLSETAEATLLNGFQHSPQANVKLSVWRPSRRVLARIAHQGLYHDSQENIYAVAVLAYRAGWTSLVVADGLTKRQLHGTLRVGENPQVSVVAVTIRPRSVTTSAEDNVRVNAQRTTVSDISNAELTLQPRPLPAYVKPDCYHDLGIVLHDPDRAPLSLDNAASLGREEWLDSARHVLATRTPLPAELVQQVMSYASSGTESPIALPSWVRNDEGRVMTIFLLFPTTAATRQTIQSTLEGATKDWMEKHGHAISSRTTPYKLISWEHHRAMSRRQLMKLWYEYAPRRGPGGLADAFFFLGKPVDNAADIQIGIFHKVWDGQANVTHKPLHVILEHPYPSTWRWEWELPPAPGLLSLDREENEVTELFHAFDQPFYSNPPPWLPTQSRLNYVAVFALTKTTPNQTDAIQAELCTWRVREQRFEEKVACFVPWDGEEDGTLDDIWRIVQELAIYHRGSPIFYPIFFVDRQSTADNTVLAVRPRPPGTPLPTDLPSRNLGGFSYGRVPGRDAHYIFDNVSMRRNYFSDLAPVNVFRRPDWPAALASQFPPEGGPVVLRLGGMF